MPAFVPHSLLEKWFRAAVHGADPTRATRAAVASLDGLAPGALILAVGKGAAAMARGALEAAESRGVRIDGGLVATHATDDERVHGLPVVIGNHPVPGAGSLRAADRLAEAADSAADTSDALVLISGGTTSLVAAPVPEVSAGDVRLLFESLHRVGRDIVTMNSVRKRVLRFGAGRLAVALKARRIHCLIASDVPGNDPAFIGSGPCTADPLTASDLLQLAGEQGFLSALPEGVRSYLEAVQSGRASETPKPDHPRFATTTVRIVLDNSHAVHGAADAARASGAAPVHVGIDPLEGEAARAGDRLARWLVRWRASLDESSSGSEPFACAVFGGETTVRLEGTIGRGGRSQELALACARTLHELGAAAEGIHVLSAGTDGRDGPTDAAGAIVDCRTWSNIAAAGRDPADDLARHASYDALDAAGSLFRPGATGTNVNDVVISLVERV